MKNKIIVLEGLGSEVSDYAFYLGYNDYIMPDPFQHLFTIFDIDPDYSIIKNKLLNNNFYEYCNIVSVDDLEGFYYILDICFNSIIIINSINFLKDISKLDYNKLIERESRNKIIFINRLTQHVDNREIYNSLLENCDEFIKVKAMENNNIEYESNINGKFILKLNNDYRLK